MVSKFFICLCAFPLGTLVSSHGSNTGDAKLPKAVNVSVNVSVSKCQPCINC